MSELLTSPPTTDTSRIAWGLMLAAMGKYAGAGVNHEGENFKATLVLTTKLPDKVIAVQASAKGEHGEVYHQEMSWMGRDSAGQLNLFIVSNNHPAIVAHVFDRIECTSDCQSIVFRHGDLDDESNFREEVCFSLYSDGSLSHSYAWGLPGGEFQVRSESRLIRQISPISERQSPVV